MTDFGVTRVGVYELAQLIEHGYCPVSFPNGWDCAGGWVAPMAIQMALPIVPIWIEGHDDLRVLPPGRAPAVEGPGGPADSGEPYDDSQEVIEQLEAALDGLAGEAGHAGCT